MHTNTTSFHATAAAQVDVDAIIGRIRDRSYRVGIIGMGYVGLPLAAAFCDKGFHALGFDIDPAKVDAILAGRSYIKHIPQETIGQYAASGLLSATGDFAQLAEVDAIIICVPTPLSKQREPDLTFVVETTKSIAPHLKPGHLVSLESTTYPGTTREVMLPILEAAGLRSGRDFFLAYSPEREDPGNPVFSAASTPKVVGGDGEDALRIATKLYGSVVSRAVAVSSPETAEAVKLTENIFRSINIALVNELKLVYEAMGVDVWEVIEAAKTKPFGFMPFYPGPGLGGHCIPIDPFYLTWKAREYGIATRFIELAGEINTQMPRHVVAKLAEALDRRFGRGLNGAKILILGVAYKKNVDDMRESPALTIMELLEERGAKLDFHDPYFPEIPRTREHPEFAGWRSEPLTEEALAGADAVLIVTDHDDVDYGYVVRHARLVVDTRNATRAVTEGRERIVKA